MKELPITRIVADPTEAAYRRGDLFEKRRRLITAWAAFCQEDVKMTAAIVPFGRSTTA